MSGAQQDMAGLHLEDEADEIEKERERERFREKPVSSMKQEELIAKVKRDEAESGQQNISLIVVGAWHVTCSPFLADLG
jgi:elongation factor 1 alpha-like protein